MARTVLMQCLTPFPQGTELVINGHKYKFAFNASGHAVAEVLATDVATIKSISAGYVEYEGQDGISYDDAAGTSSTWVEQGVEGSTESTTAFLRPATTAPKPNPKAAKKKPAKKAKKAAAAG